MKSLAEALLKSWFPLQVKNACRGTGSFLAINMVGKNSEVGESHLWIYLCSWVIEYSGTVILRHDTDLEDENWSFLRELNKTELISLKEHEDCLCFKFSCNISLTVWPDLNNYNPQDELFMLFIGGVIIYYTPESGMKIEEKDRGI